MCEEDMFMASLISNLDDDCEKLLVCKMELNCVKTLQFEMKLNHIFATCCVALQEQALNACPSDFTATYFLGKSPFPDLDKFVESIASIGNIINADL
ncbi:hypothetical protein CJ030_MR1G020563 [Morella rubra]|uniref:DNA-directed primase/polymerase protein n=1 Tax=Morella rubra TaxID=262757 RepID=A0A6A1WP59_9ROSI|nr:hypothetical protein CJ030_MR1G020563 [Morella rubra]